MAGKWFLKEEKLSLLTECEQGIDSIKKIAKKYGVHVKTICEWRTLYQVTEEVCNDQETEVLLNMPPKKKLLIRTLLSKRNCQKTWGFRSCLFTDNVFSYI